MDEPKLVPPAPPDRPWNRAQRVLFRFVFGFWFWTIFPWPLDEIPRSEAVFELVDHGVNRIVVWNGSLLGLALNLDAPPTGSGDGLRWWVARLVNLELAAVTALLWSAIAWRRRHHRPELAFLRVWLRYWLAGAFLTYGLIKVFCLQMPYMLARAIEPYGKSSPMGLLWTFLGQSPGYQVFAGCCETFAGLLLLFRRTTGLGAVVGAGVMTNVFVMNMTCDVPVKLYSFVLLLGCLLLAVPEIRPLLEVLVLRRAVDAAPPRPRPRRRAIAFAVVQVLFTGWLVYTVWKSALDGRDSYGPGAPKPSITGIYDVVELRRDLRPVPLLATEPDTYARFAVDHNYGGIVTAGGRFWRFGVKFDEATHHLGLTSRVDKTATDLFWTRHDDGTVTLAGVLRGSMIILHMRPADMSEEMLYTRGFHWVNEQPFNR